MEKGHCAHRCACDNRHGPEGVRDAAMMFELVNWTSESPEDVQVGGLGGQHGNKRGVGRFAIESGAAQTSAGKKMSDRFHECVGFAMPTLPCA